MYKRIRGHICLSASGKWRGWWSQRAASALKLRWNEGQSAIMEPSVSAGWEAGEPGSEKAVCPLVPTNELFSSHLWQILTGFCLLDWLSLNSTSFSAFKEFFLFLSFISTNSLFIGKVIIIIKRNICSRMWTSDRGLWNKCLRPITLWLWPHCRSLDLPVFYASGLWDWLISQQHTHPTAVGTPGCFLLWTFFESLLVFK